MKTLYLDSITVIMIGGWYGEIYRYNGQLLIGNPREWAPSMAIAVVYEDGILRVPGRGSMKVLNNSTISLDESDQPKKDQEGNLIEYKKEFSIKPTMSADKTLMEKYAGKWINDNGGFIIKPSDEGWEIMNIRNELKVYPIQYKNNAFIMTNNSGEENKYVYDVKKNQVIATFKGEEYFYNKIYSIKIDG